MDLGLDELGAGEDVLLVEWGDTIEELLPDERLRIELTTGAGSGVDDERSIAISATGAGWAERFASLEAAVMPWVVAP